MDHLQMLREQLPTDPSEIESHLLSHFASELGGREDGSHFDNEVECSEDDDEFEKNVHHNLTQRRSGKKLPQSKVEHVEVDDKSRARPRKPHEPKPFLSIGNIPNSRKQQDPRKLGGDMRHQSFASNLNVPYNTPSRMMRSQNSQHRPMSKASSEWNSMVPKRHKHTHYGRTQHHEIEITNTANCHIQAPFKHSIVKSSPRPNARRAISPSQELREKTQIGTAMVAKVMAKTRPDTSSTCTGRLLKGKLKPMTPVVIQGPGMQQCRGIQPQGKNTYTESPSRTLQRRRHILSTLVAKDIIDQKKQQLVSATTLERPQTVESLHRTSIATDSDNEETKMEDIRPDLEQVEKREIPATKSITVDKLIIETSYATPRSKGIDSGINPINAVNESNIASTLSAMEQEEEDKEDGEGRKNSFFVTATDQATEDGTISRYDEVKQNAARPKTAFESQSRKVRFKETHIERKAEDARRSKSAIARLNQEEPNQKQTKKTKAKKKPEEKGQGDIKENIRKKSHDDDDENKGGGSGGQGNQEGGGNQSGSPPPPPDAEEDNNDGGGFEGNTNNNGNQRENQQVLRMSVSNIKQGFENPGIANHRRGRPASASASLSSMGRPKSCKLGFWEDPMKPDKQVLDLTINTKNKTNESGELLAIEYNVNDNNKQSTGKLRRPGSSSVRIRNTNSNNTSVAFGRAARPVSAGPASFKAHEKLRLISKARPHSASTANQNTDTNHMRIESYGAQLNDRPLDSNSTGGRNSPMYTYTDYSNYNSTAISRGQSGKKKKSKISVKTNVSDSDNRLYLSDLVQQTKAIICSKCCEPTLDVDPSLSSIFDNSFICKNCAKMSDNGLGNGVERKESLEETGKDHSDTDSRGSYCRGNKVNPDVNGRVTEDELLVNMDDIEASLAQVQDEIRGCINGKVVRMDENGCIYQENAVSGTDDSSTQQEQRHQSSSSGFLESVLTLDALQEHNNHNTNSQNKQNHQRTTNISNSNIENTAKTTRKTNMRIYQYTEIYSDDDINEIQAVDIEKTRTPRVQKSLKNTSTDGEENKAGNSEATNEEEEDVNGCINTYDVNLLKPQINNVYMEVIDGIRGNQAQLPTIPTAPYPPLCFHVNARPPEGHVYYFAYGIDMNPIRFSSYISRPPGDHADRYWGLLFGFKLRFNKKGVDKDAGGFPNIEYEKNSSVEGTLYLIRKEELPLVDNSMGYPEYVEKVMLPVWFLNCTEPDELGVAQYCVPAVTYVARDLWTVKDTKGLSSEYAVRQCVHAADLLSPAYKEYMISQIS